MKIALCAKYSDNSARIANSFSDSDYFFIYDQNIGKYVEKITNHIKYSVGAEIFYAQMLIRRGINMIVCKTFGEDAKQLFEEAGIETIESDVDRPDEIIRNLLSHKNKKSSAASRH